MRKADEVAGAPVLAGFKLLGPGSTAQMMGAGLGGGIGRKIGEAVSKAPTASPLGARQFAFLGITEDMLLLIAVKNGMATQYATGIMASAGRSAIQSMELTRAVLNSPLIVTFNEGTVWNFEVDKVNKRKCKALMSTLGFAPGD